MKIYYLRYFKTQDTKDGCHSLNKQCVDSFKSVS